MPRHRPRGPSHQRTSDRASRPSVRAAIRGLPRLATPTTAALAAAVLALLPASQAADLTAGIGNVAPIVTSVTVPAATPTAGTTTTVDTTILVTDANGYNDVTDVSVTVLKPDGSTVHVAAAAATFSSGAALVATYTYSFSMQFYDPAATGAATYKVSVAATDSAGATGDNAASLATFNYAELAALALGSGSIALGTGLQPGDTTGIIVETVQNQGNVQIDVQVSGTDLSHDTESASIPVDAVAYDTANDMSGSAALATSSSTIAGFDLGSGASSSKSLYFQATMPSASGQWLPSGTYTGTVTVTAVQG